MCEDMWKTRHDNINREQSKSEQKIDILESDENAAVIHQKRVKKVSI